MTRAAVCTLFEGDYHYGLGALTNSLYRNGYRGPIFAGYRGPLPGWARTGPEESGFTELRYAEGGVIRFVRVETDRHFTNYKPAFLLDVAERLVDNANFLFYFDPDIVVDCRWEFFEEWSSAGVAVCEDVNFRMPPNHPIRAAWRRLLEPKGIVFRREVDAYYNAGFIAVRRSDTGFLKRWEELLRVLPSVGVDLRRPGVPDRSVPFTVYDQDALNITVMTGGEIVSAVGPDGMNFQWGGGGYIMSHAVGQPKPWRKRMLLGALRARPPSRADKGFVKYASHPIRLYSSFRLALLKADLLAGASVGRFIRGG